MNLGLFEDERCVQLLPLVWLRAAFELRCGRDRLIDKIRRHIGPRVHRLLLQAPLRDIVADRTDLETPDPAQPWLLLNARLLVTRDITPPPVGTAWEHNGAVLALAATHAQVEALGDEPQGRSEAWHALLSGMKRTAPPKGLRLIDYPWDLILANGDELRRQCTDGGVRDGQVYNGAHLVNPAGIHIGRGACVKPGAVLDAENGPIHIDAGAAVQPGAVVIGPCYVGPRSVIRPQANIREDTSIGPVCKVGGEVEATIFQGYSNKQHDGFLGHSIVAEWVNLGAATVTSDLKNTYGTIRVSINGVGVETGQHFVGTVFGDHAKTGIGTILPTGCVIGVAANVFTQNPVPKFVPSFAWLTDAGLTRYRLEKAIRIAGIVMGRRERMLSRKEEKLLEHVAQAAEQVEAAGWE